MTYVLIVLMLILSAFFSGSEISLNAANEIRQNKAAEQGNKGAKLVGWLNDHYKLTLSTVLFGNNTVNAAASTLATIIILDILRSLNILGEGWGLTIATVLMTVIIIFLGELIPKIVAKRYADSISRLIAFPVFVLLILLFPVLFIVNLFLKLLSLIWGKDEADDAPTVSEDVLPTIIDTAEEEGVIDEEQSELLQSTLEFPDTTVYEILTHRIDMTSIDIDDNYDEIIEKIDNCTYSRIPVYEDSIDNIIGVLYTNHFYKARLENDVVNIRDLLIEPCFIHESMKLPQALKKMRKEHVHIAVIVDEFGGTDGIVTMEDILEELVGDIWDENDNIISEITMVADNTYECIGDMNIDDFFDEIEFQDKDFESEYTTLGGWAIEMLNSDPHVGDSFEYKNLVITVTEMDDMRVTKLMVIVKDEIEE